MFYQLYHFDLESWMLFCTQSGHDPNAQIGSPTVKVGLKPTFQNYNTATTLNPYVSSLYAPVPAG